MSQDRLDSWKAISDYLGRDVRTVQRWEHERGLPIHRVPGEARGAVFAFQSEIDHWLAAAPPPAAPDLAVPVPAEPRQRSRVAGVALLVVAGAAGVGWWGMSAGVRPVQVDASSAGVTGRDASGGVLWRWRIPASDRRASNVQAVVSAPDGDVFVGVGQFHSGFGTGEEVVGGRLWRVSGTGTTRWDHGADGIVVHYGGVPYRSPWTLRDFALTSQPGGRRLVLAWTHELWWPSFVEVLDDERNVVSVFHHPGWIRGSAWIPGVPDRLVISGTTNPHDGAMAALLDTRHPVAAAPPVGDPAFQCEDCGDHRPLRYLVFPRSEVNRALGGFIPFGVTHVREGRVTVRTQESDRAETLAGAEVVYEFDDALTLRRVDYSSHYWDVHAGLERDGRLTHSRAACPEQFGPPGLREWTPTGGWREVIR